MYSNQISMKHESISVDTFSDMFQKKTIKLKSRKILQ